MQRMNMNSGSVDPMLLEWREGEEITNDYLEAIVDYYSFTFGQNDEWRNENLDRLKNLPPFEQSAEVASFIASVTGMSIDEFTRAFPTIVANSESSSVELLFKAMSRMSSMRTAAEGKEL